MSYLEEMTGEQRLNVFREQWEGHEEYYPQTDQYILCPNCGELLNNLDTHFHKTTLEAEASIYSIDEGILKEIEKKKVLVQEFGYQG